LNAVAVLDAQTRGVTWALKGMTRRQHDPSLLDSGNLRIFDNRVAQEGTRIVEIDPRTQQMLWRYPAVSDPGLYSDCCGTAQRLPNGNTLMTISGPGLALESTPNGEIVWRFESPHRAGSQGEFVAMLTEMQRHARGYVSPWLGERGGVLGGGVPAPGTAPSKSRAAVP
jgi:outer membrane protein assembly factor BamB